MSEPEYTIEILEDDEVLETIRSPKQVDSMIDTVEYLTESHEFLNRVDLPYAPGRRKRPLIEKLSSAEEPKRQQHEFKNGYYIDTLANKGDKKREINRLVRECGLEVRFSGNWN